MENMMQITKGIVTLVVTVLVRHYLHYKILKTLFVVNNHFEEKHLLFLIRKTDKISK